MHFILKIKRNSCVLKMPSVNYYQDNNVSARLGRFFNLLKNAKDRVINISSIDGINFFRLTCIIVIIKQLQ